METNTTNSNLVARTISAIISLPAAFFFIFVDSPLLIIPFYIIGVWLMSTEMHNLTLPKIHEQKIDKFNLKISYGFILGAAIINSYVLTYQPYSFLSIETILLSLMLLEFLIFSFTHIFFSQDFNHCFRNQQIYLFIFFYTNFIFFHIFKLKYFFINDNSGLQDLAGFYILLAFVICWLYDSLAYFTGKKWGEKKIGLLVSTQKSWVGFICGLLSTFLAGKLVSLMLKAVHPSLWEKSFFAENYLPWFVFFILGLVAQWGDLIASLHKRSCGVKDSGNFMKGHGGFYDRNDSVILVSVVLYYFLSYYH